MPSSNASHDGVADTDHATWLQQARSALIRGSSQECLDLLAVRDDCEAPPLSGADLATLLNEAARRNLPRICLELIARGADANARGPDGGTPLQATLSPGAPFARKVLLAFDAAPDDLQHTGDNRKTLDDVRRFAALPKLHQAISIGIPELLVHFLDGGCDPLERSPQGQTAIEAADAQGRREFADLLRSHVARRAAQQAAQVLASP